jgi:type VI secretion system protein VasI
MMHRPIAVCLVVALLYVPSALAQGDLKQTIGRCAIQEGDLQRLVCYDSIGQSLGYSRTPAATNVAGSGNWHVSNLKNPLDDTRTVALSLGATTGQARFGDPVVLVIRCQSRKINAFINWSSYLGLEQTPVTTRLGAGEAKTQRWSLSTDNKATFYPGDAAALLEQLLAADRFVAQTTPYSESPITAVFELTGLSAAVKPLREVCPSKNQ